MALLDQMFRGRMTNASGQTKRLHTTTHLLSAELKKFKAPTLTINDSTSLPRAQDSISTKTGKKMENPLNQYFC